MILAGATLAVLLMVATGLVLFHGLARILLKDEDPIAPRELLLLDGRVLAGGDSGEAPEHGVALRASERAPLETCIVVDQVGALVHCDPAAIEPMPHAVAGLRAFFSGIWREEASQEYLFCLRPRGELQVTRFVWRRRIRRAVMTIRPATGDRKAST